MFTLPAIVLCQNMTPVVAQSLPPEKTTTPQSTSQTKPQSSISFVESKNLTSAFAPTQSMLVNPNLLSKDAYRALETVKGWTLRNAKVWLVVYREGNESYMFASFGGKAYVFDTNPEKGGEQYSIPYRRLFTINNTMLRSIISKQGKDGSFRLPGGAYENYITPLVQIDLNGKPLPGQINSPYWAIHSPPYYTPGQPSEELDAAGNSCLRAKIGVARFIQNFAVREMNNPSGVSFYLRRWDNSLLPK